MTWALLQERITTSTYGPQQKKFKFHLVLLTVQAVFAAGIGYLYVLYTSRRHPSLPTPPVFPNRRVTL